MSSRILLALDLHNAGDHSQQAFLTRLVKRVLRQAGEPVRVVGLGTEIRFDRTLSRVEELPRLEGTTLTDFSWVTPLLEEARPEALLMAGALTRVHPEKSPRIPLLWVPSGNLDLTLASYGHLVQGSVARALDLPATALGTPAASENPFPYRTPPPEVVWDPTADWQAILRAEERANPLLAEAMRLSPGAPNSPLRDLEVESLYVRATEALLQGAPPSARLEDAARKTGSLAVLDYLSMRRVPPPPSYLRDLEARALNSGPAAGLLLRMPGLFLDEALLRSLWEAHPEDSRLRATTLQHPSATPALWREAAETLLALDNRDLGARTFHSFHSAVDALCEMPAALLEPRVVQLLTEQASARGLEKAARRAPAHHFAPLFRPLLRGLSGHPHAAALLEEVGEAQLAGLTQTDWAAALASSDSELRVKAMMAHARLQRRGPSLSTPGAERARR